MKIARLGPWRLYHHFHNLAKGSKVYILQSDCEALRQNRGLDVDRVDHAHGLQKATKPVTTLRLKFCGSTECQSQKSTITSNSQSQPKRSFPKRKKACNPPPHWMSRLWPSWAGLASWERQTQWCYSLQRRRGRC